MITKCVVQYTVTVKYATADVTALASGGLSVDERHAHVRPARNGEDGGGTSDGG